MWKTNRLWPLVAVLWLALWSCQAASQTTIEGREERIDQKLRVNGKWTIEKDDNPSTGYQWEVEHDKEYLDFLGKEYRHSRPPGDRTLGAGGTSYFTFRALKPGFTKIIMKHRPPGKPRPFPVETYNVLIY